MLIPLLLDKGYEVRVIDNLMYGGESLLFHFRDLNFEFAKGNIRDLRTVQNAMHGCEVVVPLAAIIGFPICRKYRDLRKR
jgi:nucleoside-diphosphate-sugar epimerase